MMVIPAVPNIYGSSKQSIQLLNTSQVIIYVLTLATTHKITIVPFNPTILSMIRGITRRTGTLYQPCLPSHSLIVIRGGVEHGVAESSTPL